MMARPSVAESHVGNEWVTRAGEGQRSSVAVGPCVRGTGKPQMDPREGGEGMVDRCEGPRGQGRGQGGGRSRERGPMATTGRGLRRLLGDPEEGRLEGADGFSREEAGEGARKR